MRSILILIIFLSLISCQLSNKNITDNNKNIEQTNKKDIEKNKSDFIAVKQVDISDFIKKFEEVGKNPEEVTKLFLDSIFMYINNIDFSDNKDKEIQFSKSIAQIGLIIGQESWHESKTSKFKEKLQNTPYIFKSYVKGTSNKNAYLVDFNNYSIYIDRVEEISSSKVNVFLKSSGTDNPRSIILIKNQSKLWNIYEFSSLYADIKKPETN